MLATVASLWILDVLPALAFVAACLWVATPKGHGDALALTMLFFLLTLGRQWSYGRALARVGFDPSLASCQILGAVLLGGLLLDSVRAHRVTRRIEWKGRQYPTKGKG